MGELIEGIMEFGAQAGEVVAKIEEITASLKNLAEALDTFFNAGTLENAFSNVLDQINSMGPLLAQTMRDAQTEKLSGKRQGIETVPDLGDHRRESFSEIFQKNHQQNIFASGVFNLAVGSIEKFFIDGAGPSSKTKEGDAEGPAQIRLDILEAIIMPPWIPRAGGAHPGDINGPHSEAKAIRSPDRIDESHFKPDFTSLEKMGFIMSGGKIQNPYEQRQVDLLQRIADNTANFTFTAQPSAHQPAVIGDWPIAPNIQNTV
jgi:hypothetical protein